MVWVQQVDILYTKASRGAPAATVRNHLPRAYPMQTNGVGVFFFERYKLLEWSDFAPTLEGSEQALSVPDRCGDLVIEASEEGLKVGLRWNSAMGRPKRHDKPNAITLSGGDTARLIINGRYASHSAQVYTEATYNVAFGDSLTPDVFVEMRDPALLDMRADLW
jgi:hypothetical protein